MAAGGRLAPRLLKRVRHWTLNVLRKADIENDFFQNRGRRSEFEFEPNWAEFELISFSKQMK